MKKEKNKYSVFVSHSSDDKIDYVDDLVCEIKALGISVFYDTDALRWGDNLKEQIDNALKTCKLAVIVISPTYFGKEWTEYEINALLRRQSNENKKLILPILYRVSKEEFIKKYPTLKNIVFRYSKSQSKKELARQIAEELKRKEES